MSIVAEVIVVAFAISLLGVTALTFVRPAIVERFFDALASSAKAHYTEQAVRLLVGASLITASPLMWQSKLFWLVGWAIVASSIVLIVTPWRWHFRFGERIRPSMIKAMKIYGIGTLVFGILLLYSVIAGRSV